MSLPTRIARYEIAGRLASGGMAEILLGRLTGPSGFERAVVVKRILPHLAAEPSFRTMFLDEARIVARIRHPNVVQVQELGEEGSELYLAMEYLEGESLSTLQRRLVAAGRSIDPSLAAYVIAQACAGLHAAHELRDENGNPLHVVHRDVSPQNVFVSYRGEVKVLDFGIAKTADRVTRTATGIFKGKVAYSPREQCLGMSLDRRADIFALGVILYELTTGRRLFKRESDLLTMEAICTGDVPPPSSVVPGYPPALEAVCMRALGRLPEHRYATAAEMRTELLRVARDLGLDPEPDEALARLMRGLFEDRIASKAELLRRVEVGSDVGSIPANESDADVAIPVVEATVRDRSVFAADTGAAAPVPRARRNAPGVILAGIAAVGVLVAGAVIVRAPWRQPAASPVATAGSDAPAPRAASSVTISIASVPPGAEIWLDGRHQGTAPATISVAQGERALPLALKREGFVDVAQEVVPDVDQRIVVTLVAKAAPAASRRPATSPRTGAPAVAKTGGAPAATARPTSTSSQAYRRFD